MTVRTPNRIIIAVAGLCLIAASGSAQTSEYFMVSGDQATFTVVQNGQIIRQWSVAPGTDNYQYPIVVLDTVRTMGADALDFGAEYDLDGNDLGTRYLHEEGPSKSWDGTTDGAFNYTIDTGGYIWQCELDWSNPVQLFRVNSLGSLTYDPDNDSLWVSQFSSSLIAEYTKDGTLLRSWDAPHDQCMALALDPADGTLWLHNRTVRGTIEQYDKDGNLLDSIAVPGLEAQNALGGEFAFGGTPGPTLEVEGDCPGRMRFVANGMTGEGNVAFIYAFGEGDYVIPGGPCAGTTLGLDSSVKLGAVKRADPEGAAILITQVPAGACGRVFVQVIDIPTCGTTNVVGI